MTELSEERLLHLTNYIVHREQALDREMLPYGDPVDKDVLVFGAGHGTEVLWAIRHGAKSVLAIDIKEHSPAPLERALAQFDLTHDSYEFRTQNVHDTSAGTERFDLILSNGAFEHVHDLKGVMGAFRSLLKPSGRVAIVADSLWWSSNGGHIKRDPWEHLWLEPAELKQELHPFHWDVYCNQVNRMTTTDFIEALRAVGAVILQFQAQARPEPELTAGSVASDKGEGTRLGDRSVRIRDQL
jgi:SAM-dependent methyltransferase